ncbi:hypothetical protein B0H17DRAFT_1123757 [Mycena rosella]|uniref:Uncharacterized protein n=1 Tax=Mycena rosella TaxID=1033263 RepID=A0AAD7MCM7_MYCRO|nr:hypothetical protein B0H17DRAFT_1123757 [Mycena rosella]
MPSHYREHMREQDGWTVLAPPPDPAGDQPPPYTPEALPQVAIPAVAATEPTLAFEIPINSNVIGAASVTRSKKYGRNVPFATAYVEICTAMGLDHSTAALGTSGTTNGPATLSMDWQMQMIGTRARIRQVICMVKNLNPPEEAALTASKPTGNRKRKSGASVANNITHDVPEGHTKAYLDLKAHLQCAKHTKELCYISAVDGHHHRVNEYELGLWSKEIDFFLKEPERKKARTSKSDIATPCAPTIHVTVNTGRSPTPVASSSHHRAPLATIKAATANADNLPASLFRPPLDFHPNGGSDIIHIPSITAVLQSIDDSGIFEHSSVLDSPAVCFADALHKYGIHCADEVVVLSADFLVQVTNMPEPLAELFFEECLVASTPDCDGKGKGRAVY